MERREGLVVTPPGPGPVDDDGPATDAEIIRRSLHRPEGFAEIFDRHADEILRYIHARLGPDLAEDLVAETFLAAFRRRAHFDLSRPDARPWLYGIATREIGRHRRAEGRRRRALQREWASGDSGEFAEGALDRVAAQRLRPRLEGALAALSPAERDLLLLIAWADLNYAEAAEALGIPVGTVRSRLHRLRAKFRRSLGAADVLEGDKESDDG